VAPRQITAALLSSSELGSEQVKVQAGSWTGLDSVDIVEWQAGGR